MKGVPTVISPFLPEEFFRSVFDEINDAVLVYDFLTSQLVKCNKRVFQLFGFTEDCDLEDTLADCLTEEPYTFPRLREYGIKALTEGPQSIEWKVRHRDGRLFWIELSLKRARLTGRDYLVIVMRNITRLKEATEDSETRFRELAESLPEVVYEIDTQGKLTFCNNAAFDFFDATWEDFERGINVFNFVAPDDMERIKANFGKVMGGDIHMGGNEYALLKNDGTRIPVILHARPIIKNGVPVGARGFIIDITTLKENEEKLRFLSCHDSLTGLHNRNFFEEKMHELNGACCRVILILCDVDGLKIVNDTLGHCAGDKILVTTADMITRGFNNKGIMARIGGDEFAVLMINGSLAAAQLGISRVTEAVERYNSQRTGMQLPLSLSLGMAFNTRSPVNPWDLFKEADNNMYRQKLYHSQSTRSAIVQTLLKALEARDFITEGHADRLRHFVSGLARSLKLSDQKVTDLCLFAHFHDIGKVGVPDRLLFKKGTFTPKEFAEMQRHSEIGYRIAQSSPDLAPIADWILKHHEWWNGKGYPLGLKGKAIPLECRMLSIADAYDAMTNDRPYRKAIPHEEAVKELQDCAGIQFDPYLVERFIRLLPELIAK